ncbi:hypothetical protein LJK87_13355 [Paenibacillus sp. P25]|nr:hypothetical protein LJK87_13355 [Paenibacillus sp. P25]
MNIHRTFGEKLFDVVNYAFLALVALLTFLPFVYVVVASFGSDNQVWPTHYSLGAYQYIFGTRTFLRSLGVSAYITIIGTFLSLAATSLMSYSLSYKQLAGPQQVHAAHLIHDAVPRRADSDLFHRQRAEHDRHIMGSDDPGTHQRIQPYHYARLFLQRAV